MLVAAAEEEKDGVDPPYTCGTQSQLCLDIRPLLPQLWLTIGSALDATSLNPHSPRNDPA